MSAGRGAFALADAPGSKREADDIADSKDFLARRYRSIALQFVAIPVG